MKQALLLLLCLLLLISGYVAYSSFSEYSAHLAQETAIVLSDDGITVNSGPETDAVFTSHDIIYYEDRDYYDSGHVYGEGLPEERHSAQEAAAHTVVNITAPGTYRVSGKLSAGQLRIDLGEDAYYDPKAVVNLILSDAEITCTVAPAILFLNAYECDNRWAAHSPTSTVDTSHAGVNLVLEGRNTVSGSHVAKIYKDKNKQKKLWKQDGAIQSTVSMNIDGPGALELTGDQEGLSSALHLTILGGDLAIRAVDDGINASEDHMSVLTIHGGNIRVLSGLSEEGDGIDSNGFLTINDGTVVVWTNPNDSPLDGNKIFLNGGTVIAFGSDEDALRGDSRQAAMYLTGSQFPPCDSSLAVIDENGNAVLAYDPAEDPFLGRSPRPYMTFILSSPGLSKGKTYQIHAGVKLSGDDLDGVYQNAQIERPGVPIQNLSAGIGSIDFCMNKTVNYFTMEYLPAA